MADERDRAAGPGQPAGGPLAGDYLQFDLRSTVQELRREDGAKAGQNARTLVKYDDFRVVLITLDRDARIPWHHTAGRISIHTVAGHVRVHVNGRSFDLPTGSLLALDRTLPHEVEALEPSGVLLTIAWGEEALEAREAAGGKA